MMGQVSQETGVFQWKKGVAIGCPLAVLALTCPPILFRPDDRGLERVFCGGC
jgi:hypothetical protein